MSEACATAASASTPAVVSSARASGPCLRVPRFIVASSAVGAPSEIHQQPDTAFGVGAIHRAADLAVKAARSRGDVAVAGGDHSGVDLFVLHRESHVDLLVRMPGDTR